MTTLVKHSGSGVGSSRETPVPLPLHGAGRLVARLREEAARQVAFSEARLLFREAASTIERLDGELTRATARLVERTGQP